MAEVKGIVTGLKDCLIDKVSLNPSTAAACMVDLLPGENAIETLRGNGDAAVSQIPSESLP